MIGTHMLFALDRPTTLIGQKPTDKQISHARRWYFITQMIEVARVQILQKQANVCYAQILCGRMFFLNAYTHTGALLWLPNRQAVLLVSDAVQNDLPAHGRCRRPPAVRGMRGDGILLVAAGARTVGVHTQGVAGHAVAFAARRQESKSMWVESLCLGVWIEFMFESTIHSVF